MASVVLSTPESSPPDSHTWRLPRTSAGSAPRAEPARRTHTHTEPVTLTPPHLHVNGRSRRNIHVKETCNMKVENQDKQQKILEDIL